MIKTLSGFKKFILRGNAVDLAVGIMFGAALGAVMNSLVKDVLTPLISSIFKIPDFSDLVFTIGGSRISYGEFLNSLISFFVIAFSVYFFVVIPLNKFLDKVKKGEAPQDPTTKKCSECLSNIPLEAKRCSYCTQIVK
jgi:large conductance mechanosensitive channel